MADQFGNPTLEEMLAGAIGPPEDIEPFAPALPPMPMSEPNYLAEFAGPQQPTPDDFFARVAQGTGGAPPFGPIRVTSQTPGGGLLALLALMSGIANAKTGQATRRINETEKRNMEARENARMLAQHRWKRTQESRDAAFKRAQIQAGLLRQTRAQEAADRRFRETTVPVQTPEGVKRAGIASTPGQVATGIAPSPKEKFDESKRRQADLLARIRDRLATKAAADSLSESRKDFSSRKRSVISSVNDLKNLYGENRKNAREAIARFLEQNPDVAYDAEVRFKLDASPK